MAEYISVEELSTLQPAASLKEVASGAALYHELHSIARACNQAANTGQLSVSWDKSIHPDNLAKLKAQGYLIDKCTASIYPDSTYIISWDGPKDE